MNILAISDFDPTSVGKDQDWLYDSYDISVISSTVPQSCQALLTNNKDNFKPFNPDINTSTQSMQIIANLPDMKEGEFDHEYMAQHIEQLQMDPTLCSKCSPAIKYFCSPEPVVQELYK